MNAYMKMELEIDQALAAAFLRYAPYPTKKIPHPPKVIPTTESASGERPARQY
jgi:hypothetical protein